MFSEHLLALATVGCNATWWSDLHHVAMGLPKPVHIPLHSMPTGKSVDCWVADVKRSLADYLNAAVLASARLPILQRRFLHNNRAATTGGVPPRPRKMQPYLSLQSKLRSEEALPALAELAGSVFTLCRDADWPILRITSDQELAHLGRAHTTTPLSGGDDG
ncbi:hypothetical protein C8Q78DRAFT_1076043 [Trametes maxima]|nr:hypothetical protein C8Q78DRAFT_1076043 [Trametes maxima]